MQTKYVCMILGAFLAVFSIIMSILTWNLTGLEEDTGIEGETSAIIDLGESILADALFLIFGLVLVFGVSYMILKILSVKKVESPTIHTKGT